MIVFYLSIELGSMSFQTDTPMANGIRRLLAESDITPSLLYVIHLIYIYIYIHMNYIKSKCFVAYYWKVRWCMVVLYQVCGSNQGTAHEENCRNIASGAPTLAVGLASIFLPSRVRASSNLFRHSMCRHFI